MAQQANRVVLTPNRITGKLAAGATRPRLNYFFEFPPEFTDTKVIVVVYHMGIYRSSNLFGHDKRDSFDHFTNPDPAANVLPDDAVDDLGSVLNPTVKHGVLLTITGNLEQVQKHPEVKLGRGYWLRIINVAESSAKAWAVIDFGLPHVEEKDGKRIFVSMDSAPAARIVVPDDTFQNMFTDHPLALRMAVLDPAPGASSLKKGSVIASSLCKEHNPAHNGKPPDVFANNTAYVMLTQDGAIAARPPKIGGPDSTLQPITPRKGRRVQDPDLTGLYEADGTTEPALRLHVNQAGESLVGWFSVPKAVHPNAQPAAVANLPLKPGCIWIDNLLKPAEPEGIRFEWGVDAKASDRAENHIDPDDVFTDPPPKDLAHGWLRPVKDKPRLIDVTFEQSDGKRTPAIRMHLVQHGARWPFGMIDQLPREEKAAALNEQVAPASGKAWDILEDQLKPNAAVTANETLTDIIKQWQRGAGASKVAPRIAMSNYIRSVLDPFSDFKIAHMPEAAVRFQSLAEQVKITGDNDETHTLLQWLREMVADAVTEAQVKRSHGDPLLQGTDQQLYQAVVEQGFKDAGIWPSGNFKYKLAFLDASLPVPVVTVAGFQMVVTRQRKQIVAGKETWEDDQVWGSQVYHGIFMGIGIGAKLNKDSLKNPKSLVASPSLGDTEVESLADVAPDDFNGAWFNISSLEFPKASLGEGKGGVSGNLGSSSLFQIYLNSGIELSAITDQKFKGNIDKKGENELKLFAVTTSWGKLFRKSDIPKRVDPPLDSSNAITKPSSKEVQARVPGQFAFDSSELLQTDRMAFERQLAIGRAFFDTGAPKVRVLGFTSPEGTKQHNKTLSDARAAAIVQAIKDAFGEDVEIEFDTQALGEDPSLAKGNGLPELNNMPMIDPPGGPGQVELVRDQARFYPRWRVVHVYVSNQLIVSVGIKTEQKGPSP